MSVWSYMEGYVTILKKDKVSIRKVIEDCFTDEFVLDIKTTDVGDAYLHTISCRVCIDGYDFIEKYQRFLDELKPVKRGMDLSFTIRFLV